MTRNWARTGFRSLFVLLAFCVTSISVQAGEIPMFADRIASGELPPMQKRLPDEPLIVDFAEEAKSIGKYGGDIRLLMAKAKDTRQMPVYSYARIIGYGPDFELKPDIAKSFKVIDGREFVFTLRKGHKWSDGHPLTTEDFRYFWEDMATHPEIGRAGLPIDMLVDGEGPVFEVIDELTFKYSWSKPNPAFLPALAGASPLYIYRPAHYLKQFHARYADADKLAAYVEEGNAKDWVSIHTRKQRQRRSENPDLPTLQAWWNRTAPPSTRFIFERNPYFHRVDPNGNQLPYVDNVIMSIVSKDVIPAKTGTGESDLQARYLRFDHIPFLKQGEAQGNIKTLLWSVGRGSQVALFPNLNAADPIWRELNRDVRFRRAFSLAINREEINESIYFGLATPSANTIMPDSGLYETDFGDAWISHDPDQANVLLDDIGLTNRDGDGIRLLPNGERLEITVESAGESTEETDVLELISSQMTEVGIKMFVRASQRDIFRRRANSGETVMSVFNGLDNAVPSPGMSPQELAPTAQPQLSWPMWGQHFDTGGKAGEPVDMESAKQQLMHYKAWLAAVSDDERERIWKTMLSNYTDQVFSIGTVNNSRQPVVVSADLRNVPEEAIYAWEPTSYFGAYRMDTFWYDR